MAAKKATTRNFYLCRRRAPSSERRCYSEPLPSFHDSQLGFDVRSTAQSINFTCVGAARHQPEEGVVERLHLFEVRLLVRRELEALQTPIAEIHFSRFFSVRQRPSFSRAPCWSVEDVWRCAFGDPESQSRVDATPESRLLMTAWHMINKSVRTGHAGSLLHVQDLQEQHSAGCYAARCRAFCTCRRARSSGNAADSGGCLCWWHAGTLTQSDVTGSFLRRMALRWHSRTPCSRSCICMTHSRMPTMTPLVTLWTRRPSQ